MHHLSMTKKNQIPPSPASTLTWAQTAALNPHTPICLSCGVQLCQPLARLGSLRCHSCRALDAPLDCRLVHSHVQRAA